MSLLLKNIYQAVTFNDKDEVLKEVDILVNGRKIESIGKNLTVEEGTEIIDCTGLLALPGFVNTHHHLYQTLFRGIQEVQEMPLFPWLTGLYEFWKHLTPEAVYYGALVGFSELLRTGCTTSMDHHYVFPKNQPSTLIDEQIKAASEIGIRFHATRGSMSRGKSEGGLPPDSVVQSSDEILEDSERLIDKYHDNSKFAMHRIALAPCSPFSVTKELMVESRDLARKKGVMLHTHLAETKDEEQFCLDMYGRRPVELMVDLGWTGPDVWFAHVIHLNLEEMKMLKGSGVAHCPSSNMKLSSGICPTNDLINAGVKLSIAVDGSASNDGSNMWEEIRRAYLLNHLKYGYDGLNAYDILKLATRGGAEVLGRDDIGILKEDMAADIVLFDLNDIAYAGCHDPLVGLVTCGNTSLVKMTIVNGKVVVKDGNLLTIDSEKVRLEAHKIASDLIKLQRSLS
ncbi:8-oxoguanine deaminase [Clostridium thermopalmarium]|uniref:8-oxoguanine deaminase n=1 Tax=Clostridium thermopalmarium DSM 5974 TaxID=1121340 RepID=A0A2T0ASJ3_9CLOT|nr:8-oxoguanine deaminase [Clostridium thermopalmarium]MBE6044890.1 8-oxoguanine deaminase [Clostridium thermopalmarium]PRR73177.1 8-oxoguanine deaminase [Clostridium thermopalmarium DSM 5974]PVZ25258.1 cytosine/adenosine deaminase-related metal-dependent hydrolase [Clostridium thermopalmarium DSM 5974]